MTRKLTWQIGHIEISAIQELTDAGNVIQEIIPQATNAAVRKTTGMTPHFADKSGNLFAVVQSFLVRSKGKNILIDTGNGNGKTRTDMPAWGNLKTNFLSRLRMCKVLPEEIDMVINTHFHFDHVGWNTKRESGRWIPTFPNAEYLFPKEEYNYWINNPQNEILDDLRGIQDSIQPIIKSGLGKIVSSDFKLNNEISFVSSPGHTPGHICIKMNSNGQTAMIGGDLIYHPCQVKHVNWTAESDHDKQLAIKTRKKIFAQIVNTETLFFGAHIPAPVAGYIRSDSGSLYFQSISR